MRTIFGGSGVHDTFFFDLVVSEEDRYFSGEVTAKKDFSGELGAVTKTSSPLVSVSPRGTTCDNVAII